MECNSTVKNSKFYTFSHSKQSDNPSIFKSLNPPCVILHFKDAVPSKGCVSKAKFIWVGVDRPSWPYVGPLEAWNLFINLVFVQKYLYSSQRDVRLTSTRLVVCCCGRRTNTTPALVAEYPRGDHSKGFCIYSSDMSLRYNAQHT